MIVTKLAAQGGAFADPPLGDQRRALKMAFGRKTPSHLAAKPGSPDAAVAEQGGLERIRRIRPAPGVLLAPVDRTGDGNTADRGRNPRIALQTGRAAGSLHI